MDTGGTFTDLVLWDGTDRRVAKVPSTPEDPSRAIAAGLELLGGVRSGDHVVHGTTVALNALLTGETARVALVTNEGFRDLIEIGRQDRPEIYALHPVKPEPLVPRSLRFELPQRTWPAPAGEQERFATVRRPTRTELELLRERIGLSGAEAIAVCLLHSWARPEIEREVERALEGLSIPITLSAAVLPEHREVERFSTAIVNAALVPLLRAYLGSLSRRVGRARLSVLQATGGTLAADRARDEPVRVILSGPAGGVVGAARAAREAGFEAFCGLDMGGTSTDVSFHDAREAERPPTRALEPVHVAGHAVAVPSLDIHTIGCGGGSLVTVDEGGVLHVGPESAGADPGPVCYGKGAVVPTVTDAHVLLDHIAGGRFLGGELALDVGAVRAAFEQVASRLGTSPIDAALGVLDVARAAMRRAIGVMTMQRGQDPERLPLIAFGGAGGLHAAALAESLRMRGALVPNAPGALSAIGMTCADALHDAARASVSPLAAWSWSHRDTVCRELSREGRAALREAGFAARAIEHEHGMDLRYRGQSYEIHVPEGPRGFDPSAAFHRAHEALYGYALPDREVELVCLRSRSRVRAPIERLRPARARRLPRAAIAGERSAVFDRRRRAVVIDRERLAPGHAFEGPALVEEYSGTSLVPPGWKARITAGGHLWMQRG